MSSASGPDVGAVVIVEKSGKTVLDNVRQQILEMLDINQYQRCDSDEGLFSEYRPIKLTIQVSGHTGTQHRIFKADHHRENDAPFPQRQPDDRLPLKQALDAAAQLGNTLAAVIVARHELLLDFRFELIEAAAQFGVGSEYAALIFAENQGRPVNEDPVANLVPVWKRWVFHVGVSCKASPADAVVQVRLEC